MRARAVAGAALLVSMAATAIAAEFPRLTGRVVDAAGILDARTEQALAARLEAHERAGGNQVVVATVKSLEGEPIERYGVDLARAWGLGQKDEDNGVLLLVAPAERGVRIEVGYGLEGDLPDAIASNIIQTQILPRFRDGDFDAGVTAGVVAIIDALGGQYAFRQEPAGRERDRDGVPFGFLWIIVLFLLFGFGGRRRRGFGSGLLWGAILGGTLGGGRRGGGGFGGGGGFSGGGGSFGGGGASGSW